MKRIISCLIIFTMTFSVVNVVAENDEIKNVVEQSYDFDTYDDAQTLMLDIMGHNVFGEEPDAIITRAQFVAGVLSIFRTQILDGCDVYKDVTIDNEYFGHITTAFSMGLISPSENFYPNEAVTLNQAIKIIISATDYKVMAEFKGGFPVGYFNVAKDMDLLDCISNVNSEQLTMADATILFYNLMHAQVCKQGSFGDAWEYVLTNKIYLEELYELYAVDGIVTAVDYSSLLPETSVPTDRNTIKISGVEYEYSTPDVKLLGKSVKAYIDENKKAYSVIENISNNEAIFVAKDYIGINGNVISFDKDGKTRKERLDSLYKVIYNGRRVLGGITDEMLSDDYADIRLLDADDNGKFEVVFIDAFSYLQIANTDYFTDYISFVDAPDKFIDLSENYDIICDIYDESGSPIKLHMLEPDLFVGVKSSLDSLVHCVYVCNQEPVSGEVTSISSSENTMDINGVEYVVSSSFINKYIDNKNINIGDKVKVYKGMKETLEYLVETDGGFVYGLLADAKKGNGLDDSVYFKIFTNKGFEIFSCANSISFDTKQKLKDKDKIYNKVANHIVTPEIIRYSLNAEGKITHIDFYEDQSTSTAITNLEPKETHNSLVKYRSVLSRYRSNSNGLIGVGVLSNAVMIVDRGSTFADDERYSYVTTSNLTNNVNYGVELYDVDKDGYVGCAFITSGYTGSSTSETINTYMVEKAIRSIYDDVLGYNIICYGNGLYRTLFLPDDSLENDVSGNIRVPRPGDLVRFTIKEGSVIDEYYLDFAFDNSVGGTDVSQWVIGNSVSGTHMYNNTTPTGASYPNAGFAAGNICDPDGVYAIGYITGNVYNCSKNMMLYNSNTTPLKDDIKTYLLPETIILFDTESSTIVPYSANGIKSFINNPGEQDFVVLRCASGKPRFAFVYR